jgi:hypothetical protein
MSDKSKFSFFRFSSKPVSSSNRDGRKLHLISPDINAIEVSLPARTSSHDKFEPRLAKPTTDQAH